MSDDQEVYGFATLPHRLCRRREFSDNAYRILGAVMWFCHDKATCFPSNSALGDAAGGKAADTVRRGLVELEKGGIIRRILNPSTNRRDGIELLWKEVADPLKSKGLSTSNLRGYPLKFKGLSTSNLRGLEEEEEREEEKTPLPPTESEDAEPDFDGPRKPTERELRRLQELGDELFGEMTEFGAYACRLARLWEPAWVAEALKRAATSGKKIQPRYLEGILRGFQGNDPPGPEKPAPSGKGRAPATGPTGPTNYLTGKSNQRYPGQDDNGRYEGQR